VITKKLIKSIFYFCVFFGNYLLPLSCFPFSCDEDFCIITGVYRFKKGDSIKWASPFYNDSKWSVVTPQHSSPRGINWYRLHFFLPKKMKNCSHLGVLLHVITDAYEVYLNGVKIGEMGRVGDRFILTPCISGVYLIPHKDIIRFGDENVLALRTLSIFFKREIWNKSIVIGNYWKLKTDQLSKINKQNLSECFLFTILITFFLFNFFIYKVHKEKEYFFASLIILFYTIVLFLDSSVFYYNMGYKNAFCQRLSFSIFSFLPFFLLLFLKKFFKEYFPLIKIYFIFSIIFSIFILFFFSLHNSNIFLYVWILFILPSYIISFIVLIYRAYKRNYPNSIIVSIGIVIFIICTIIENVGAIFQVFPEKMSYNLYLQDYGILIFISSLTYSTMQRFFSAIREKEKLSIKVLYAQEKERRRIASELHDGLGQSLLTIKFYLQDFNKVIKDKIIKNIIQELDLCIDTVREISMGLRPAILDRLGLVPAIKAYGENFARKTGIKIKFFIEIKERPIPLIEDNLFRIFQESLNNIFKHAHANSVIVSLFSVDEWLILRIIDDGCGFDYEKDRIKSKGLGLSTIKERVELMKGRLYVKTQKDMGTDLVIEVPYAKDNGSR